jgi:hypothetical protein
LEIQVHEKTDNSKYGMVAAIRDAVPRQKRHGEASGRMESLHYHLQRQSRECRVQWGRGYSMPTSTTRPEKGKNPDRHYPNKFKIPLEDFARTGPLGLSRIARQGAGSRLVPEHKN